MTTPRGFAGIPRPDLDEPDEPPDCGEEPVGEDVDPWEYLQDAGNAAEEALRNREA